jgi:hypothetical protein
MFYIISHTIDSDSLCTALNKNTNIGFREIHCNTYPPLFIIRRNQAGLIVLFSCNCQGCIITGTT